MASTRIMIEIRTSRSVKPFIRAPAPPAMPGAGLDMHGHLDDLGIDKIRVGAVEIPAVELEALLLAARRVPQELRAGLRPRVRRGPRDRHALVPSCGELGPELQSHVEDPGLD